MIKLIMPSNISKEELEIKVLEILTTTNESNIIITDESGKIILQI